MVHGIIGEIALFHVVWAAEKDGGVCPMQKNSNMTYLNTLT